MLAIERKQQIYSMVKDNHMVYVSDLSQKLNVTEETIRRDLKDLERRGLIMRSHGGAVLRDDAAPSFTEREDINFGPKSIIADLAQEFIKDGMTIMADTSTTAKFVINRIDSSKKLTVITNSYKLINDLSQKPNLRLFATGGECFGMYKAYVGRDAIATINRYNADLAILGCFGLAQDRGLMENNSEESDIKMAMAEHSLKTMICADSSKFDRYSKVNTIKFGDIDIFITNEQPDETWLETFKKHRIKCVYPN